MTVPQTRSATTKRLLDQVLAELLDTVDRRDPLDSAIVSAVEGAALIAQAAEEAGLDDGGGKAVELAKEALGAMRASVIATTVSVRTLADRRRERAVAESAGRRA
ncbi:hypothetical protein ABZ864_41195 [Streptomyces sp. NPDC047082]|uniref:hypothetical protein n=1 Tax=Streptomyces sp. NPDC047082 TaxID=3155259 RepID=UPI0033D5DB56